MTIGDALPWVTIIIAILVWNIFRHSKWYKEN